MLIFFLKKKTLVINVSKISILRLKQQNSCMNNSKNTLNVCSSVGHVLTISSNYIECEMEHGHFNEVSF